VVAVGGITCQITYSTSNPAAPAGRMSYRAICLDLRKKRDRERGRDRGETEGGGQDRRGRWLLSLLWRKGGPGGDGGREFCWREVSGFVRVSSEVLLCAQAATARPSLLPRYLRPVLRLGWMQSRVYAAAGLSPQHCDGIGASAHSVWSCQACPTWVL